MSPVDRQHHNATHIVTIEHLRGPDGKLLGGEVAEAAISSRMVRQRQAFLRDLGMVEVADQLPGKWKPGGI